MLRVEYNRPTIESLLSTRPPYYATDQTLSAIIVGLLEENLRSKDKLTQSLPLLVAVQIVEFMKVALLAGYQSSNINESTQEPQSAKDSKEVLQQFNINVAVEIQTARMAITEYLQQLAIPQNTKKELFIAINQAIISMGDTLELGQGVYEYKFRLSPTTAVLEAQEISRNFGQELTSELLRAMIWQQYLRMAGRLILCECSELEEVATLKLALEKIEDFPVSFTMVHDGITLPKYKLEKMDIYQSIPKHIFTERFVEHFVHAIILQSGLPRQILQDHSRVAIADQVARFKRAQLLISTLEQALCNLAKEPDSDQKNALLKILKMVLFKDALLHTSLARFKAFSQPEIESIITQLFPDLVA